MTVKEWGSVEPQNIKHTGNRGLKRLHATKEKLIGQGSYSMKNTQSAVSLKECKGNQYDCGIAYYDYIENDYIERAKD